MNIIPHKKLVEPIDVKEIQITEDQQPAKDGDYRPP
jgi:hypothetical protein